MFEERLKNIKKKNSKSIMFSENRFKNKRSAFRSISPKNEKVSI